MTARAQESVAETLAKKISAIAEKNLPAKTKTKCEELLIDVIGLCVTARNENYVKSALAGWEEKGPCTVIGHAAPASAAAAAFVNGPAGHCGDFGATFEGRPPEAGAVIVPAVLAICEQPRAERPSALLGIA